MTTMLDDDIPLVVPEINGDLLENLPPGSIIVASTDGVWEARDESEEMFGKDRLAHIMRNNKHKSAEAIQDAVLEAVSDFRGDTEQEDDITIVVLKVLL